MVFIQAIRDYLFEFENEVRVVLRDQGDPGVIFKGQSGSLTSDCVRKTLFYGYQFLSYMKGDLMSLGPNHAVIKLDGEIPSYMVLVMNYDEKAQRLMDTSSTMYQAYDAISGCMDELEATLNFPVEPGTYYSARYLIDDTSSIFGFMGKMGFPEIGQDIWDPFNRLMRIGPRSETGIITFGDTASLSFNVSGVGMEIVVLKMKEE